jgi:hypothetical protein
LQIDLFEDALRGVEAPVVVWIATDVCDFVIGDASGAGVVGVV